MPETRIQWKEPENRQVAVKWIDICTQTGQDPLNPRSLAALAKQAQLVLPEARRRPETSLGGRTAVQRVLDQIAIVLEERRNSAKAQEVIKKRSDDEAAEERAQEAARAAIAAAAHQIKPLPDLPEMAKVGADLELLVQALGQSIAGILATEFQRGMRRAFSEEFPKLLQKATQQTKTLPRILVCGPRGDQQQILEEAVDGVADLKFVSSEESAKLVTLRGKTCAASVVWVDYVNHQHGETSKQILGKNRTFLVTGGITALKDKLEEVALSLQIHA